MARNAFHLLLGQVGSTVLSIVLSAALGRTLGAADFGTYFVLVSMSTFAYVCVEWGQSTYLIRETARRPDAIGMLLGSALAFRGAAATAAILVTALVTRLLGYDGRTQALSALVILCALPLALSQPYSSLFRARDRMDLDAIVTVTAKAATVAVTLLALLIGGRLVSVILSQAMGGGAALLAAVFLARRLGLPRPRPSADYLRELASGGTSIAVFFVAMAVEPYIAAIVMSKLAPAVVVGWYGAARNIMGVLLAPATILAAAAFPQFSRTAAHPAELRRVIRQALRPLLGLGALGAVGTFLFAEFAVSSIYGRGKFDPAAAVLRVFAPVLLLFFVDMLLGTVVTAVGRTRELAMAKLLSVGASTALAVFLVPACQERFGNGGMGLAIAFGISEVVMLSACLSLIPRGVLDRGSLLDLGRAVAAATGTLALFRLLPAATPWVTLPGSVGAFAALSLVVGLVGRDDLGRVKALVWRK